MKTGNTRNHELGVIDKFARKCKTFGWIVVGLLRGDELVKFDLMCKVGNLILPRYRFKWPQMGWWDDKWFNAYLDRFDETNGMNTDRRWMLYQLMRLVDGIPGDTAECGVYRGAASYLICSVNEQTTSYRRAHHVFDSFEGLSEPSTADGRHWARGDMQCSLEDVRAELSEFVTVNYHKGWIPARFSEVSDRRFCFVHIDVDLYEPTRESIAFFYDRMNEGGVLLCDDYGFTSCPGATRAVDEFLSGKQEKMVSLPSGGGFLVKGCRTSNPRLGPTLGFAEGSGG